MKRGPEETPIPVSHANFKSSVIYKVPIKGDHLQGIHRNPESVPSGREKLPVNRDNSEAGPAHSKGEGGEYRRMWHIFQKPEPQLLKMWQNLFYAVSSFSPSLFVSGHRNCATFKRQKLHFRVPSGQDLFCVRQKKRWREKTRSVRRALTFGLLMT